MDLAELDLPARIHATVLTGRDVTNGETLTYPVVWADRLYDTCPRCDQPVNRVVNTCPAVLDTGAGTGGQILEWDQQHGCGEWLAVSWQQVRSDAAEPTVEDVKAAADQLAATVAADLATERRRLTKQLRTELQDALTRLAEPLADGETAEDRRREIQTGHQGEPGVDYEPTFPGPGQTATWHAWDFDPDGSGEAIMVTEDDLRAEDTDE